MPGSAPIRRRFLTALLAVGGSLLLLSGCGLPAGGEAQRVAPEEVPYGLLASPPTATTTAAPDSPTTSATIYLVDDKQLLVPVSVQVNDTTLHPLVQALLNRLAVGPTDRERARGVLTDLGPGASLTVRSIRDGTAYIELQVAVQDPSPGRLPVAIGQVVLTATSVVGVDRVSFVQADGTTVNVPAPPAGDSTTTPLAAGDYTSLLVPGQATPARTEPIPGPDAPGPPAPTSSS
ncbi:MAG: GerMN domain-containing protein [Lapillicoccus sp.]